MRTVIVTGSAGLIGSKAVGRFAKEGGVVGPKWYCPPWRWS